MLDYKEALYDVFVDRAAHLLLQHEESLFQRSDSMVEISAEASIKQVNRHRLRQLLNRSIRWVRSARNEQGDSINAPIAAPMLIADTMLSMPSWPFRVLDGVIRCPTFRPDKTLLSEPGYDSSTRLYYLPDGLQHEPLLERPEERHMKAALATLYELIGDFPFRSDLDRAAWLSYVLTCVARPAVAGPCPFFVADAAAKRSGKGKTINLGGLIALGSDVASNGYSEDEDEVQKVIGSKLIGAAPVFHFDNVDIPFGNQHLERLATSYVFETRKLGASEMLMARNVTVWTASGNNLRVRGDMGPRCIQWRLVSPMVDPQARNDFRIADIEAYTRMPENRVRFIRAALTILRYGYQNPPTANLPGMGSYEAWSEMIRLPVYVATGQDVIWSQPKDTDESNTELTVMGLLYGAVWSVRGDRPWYVSKKTMDEPGILDDHAMSVVVDACDQLFPGSDGDKKKRLLPRKLAAYIDKPVPATYTLSESEYDLCAARWRDEGYDPDPSWRVQRLTLRIERAGEHGRYGQPYRFVKLS